MAVGILPHALERAELRGATADEITQAISQGAATPAKAGRTMFSLDFAGRWLWRERSYATKRVEVIAVFKDDAWLAITVIVKFF